MKILPVKYNMCIHTLHNTTSTNQTSRLLHKDNQKHKSSPVPLSPSRSAGQDDQSRNRHRCRWIFRRDTPGSREHTVSHRDGGCARL
ncbi:hypothetical protein HanRHA438_Chr17g0826411 [Helianthus annuus]|nr:hypothetical protein HanHA89_Chr17g0717471 [Helianthus annuus]KAJ0633375.1 hypothetical protein HanLR1_Chr17g0675961 [Helianthus annuus]KAJ0814293.1 hypothetical protein HanPSC8_Chr17g0783901 [Helianthus annuus]KAJ0827497.1 hypothetical protein HanRHA438_Chr17g0826411 [Helianthus annuus]